MSMELQSPTNFCMLTERLHILFKRYIINGRVRAPPEFELRDMIPTFQQGAKTNRRALQSKFKSWAKRMTLLNGNLVLSTSGKIIIPQERCEEIVMELHCDDHTGIEKVITQIQRKYTWTKKNFGMDLEVVMNVISNNCKNATCKKEIGKVIKTCCKKLFQGFPVSTVPRRFSQDFNVEFAEFYNYSMEMPTRDRISSIEYPILQSYLSNRYNTLEVLPGGCKNRLSLKKNDNENFESTVLSKINRHFTEPKFNISAKCGVPQSAIFMENQKNKPEAIFPILNNGEKICFSQSLDTKDENEFEKVNISSPPSTSSAALHENNYRFLMKSGDSSRSSHSLMRSCKKPRNLHEFNKQLKDAQSYPEIYPAIFTDPKSQFLSTLGLVPKRICSKKTLAKFTKEQRKKRLMEKRRSWFVVERKVLRDRNKLIKRNSHSLRMRQQAYGSLSKPHSSSFYHSSIQNSQKTKHNFKKLKNIAKRPLRGHTETPRMIKPQFILPREPTGKIKKCPEIIDIVSSDDESPASENFRNVKKTKLSESEIQSTNSSEQNGSSQYADPRLFGYNVENAETVRNPMLYEQTFGYNGAFGAPNLFLRQNNVLNFPVTTNNPHYQNDSFYINSQTQFPILRPFFIPAASNSDIAVLQAGNFPMIRPLGPINSPNISSYFKNSQPLPKNTSTFSGQSGNSVDDEQCLFVPNGNIVIGNKESSTNINPAQPYQPNQPPSNFKVFLVNKTPKKTYLLVPPNCKTYLNTVKKIVPILDRKQPIAPRINSSEKSALNYKSTVAKELQQRRLTNALFANASYSSKQKESKKDIQSEMDRLSNWISKLKTSIIPTNFHRGVEKFSHKLTNQLNVGITLVKGVRNALIEIEKNEENIAEDGLD